MSEEDKSNELELQTSDYVAIAAKSVLGTVPFAGSLLVEIAGLVIPNQRIERLGKFVKDFEKEFHEKFLNVDKDIVKMKLTNEYFTDIIEEGVRQAARSLSDERRKYIASVIVNGLSDEDIEFVESKHLLRILGEINDIEVIWLAYYSGRTLDSAKKYLEKYPEIVTPVMSHLGASPTIIDKSVLQESYKEHLVQLGLLKRQYRIDSRTKQPEFDTIAGELKVRGYEITNLGFLLLRQLGFKQDKITNNPFSKEEN